MKNKKLMKVIAFIAILLMVAMAVMPVFAKELVVSPEDFEPSTGGTGYTKVNNAINIILGIVQLVAVGIAVIMLIVLAIKYISASPEGKADIKKSAAQYVVGAVLLFGSSGILEIVKQFAGQIN